MRAKRNQPPAINIACAARLLPLLLQLFFPAAAQAQFTYTTNNGAITITGYAGPGGNVTIPDMINGLPVTSIGFGALLGSTSLTNLTISTNVSSIGQAAFQGCTSLRSVIIPNSVTSLGFGAFFSCTSLTNVTIPASAAIIGSAAFQSCTSLSSVMLSDGVTNIGNSAFFSCSSLTNVTVPASVTSIGDGAFARCSSLSAITVDALNPVFRSVAGLLFNQNQTKFIQYPAGKRGNDYAIPSGVADIGSYAFDFCTSLTNVTIPSSVSTIGNYSFRVCTSLSSLCFQGNAPAVGSSVFNGSTNAIVYYLPGTTDWGPTFGGLPTALIWNPQVQTAGASLGVGTNGFGFTLSWVNGMDIVVEACTNLANPNWSPVQTNTLSGDSLHFDDPGWTDCPRRFYRVRSP